jgi:hypothetical protein
MGSDEEQDGMLRNLEQRKVFYKSHGGFEG